MKWKNNSPKVFQERVIRYFAWLPVTINNETRWFETVRVHQVFLRQFGEAKWVSERFVD